MANPAPVEIRRLGTRAVRIEWDDGHESEYPNRYLRDQCPCAACRRQAPTLPIVAMGNALHAEQIDLVGRYAVSFRWSDGHQSGIYSYRTLRAACPCAACAGAPRRASDSGP